MLTSEFGLTNMMLIIECYVSIKEAL